ncbi:MAG: anthranilate phosphoribosyltransferase [Mariprofundaceae bacterium]|nr:anthranilate phosphoribosyltransferase [Mariprofundaceae bacterium]
MPDVSSYIKQVARGKHGSEHLSREDARIVFSTLLKPDADLLQLGAFLITQRMKGETSQELTGFIEASRQHIQGFDSYHAVQGAVDLPCYAGKRRAAHAYLVAALHMRDAGVPIFIHGVESIEGRITAWEILKKEGVVRATSLHDAQTIMQHDGMVYMDLSDISPNLHRIYQLRPRLGVRSFANTVARLLNPMQCDGQLNGFFHTPYANYMAEANIALKQPRSLVFMGAEGEPELYADRQKVVKMQVGEHIRDVAFDDAGYEPYPRQAMEKLEDVFTQFEHMKHQPLPHELARIERMEQAFAWALGQAMEETPYA